MDSHPPSLGTYTGRDSFGNQDSGNTLGTKLVHVLPELDEMSEARLPKLHFHDDFLCRSYGHRLFYQQVNMAFGDRSFAQDLHAMPRYISATNQLEQSCQVGRLTQMLPNCALEDGFS